MGGRLKGQVSGKLAQRKGGKEIYIIAAYHCGFYQVRIFF